MSDPYLLAASLLTAGPITVPPSPALLPNLPDELWTLSDSTAPQTWQSVITHQIVPTLEITSPEFSQLQLSSAASDIHTISNSSLTSAIAQAATDEQTNKDVSPKSQSKALSPVSGNQLYLQRLAALKAGKLYTRLAADSFQSFWTKSIGSEALTLQQPTHEQWIRLLQQEANAVAKGQGSNRLGIIVGDSLSMWFPSGRLPSSQLWLNQGISGENTGQILKRLPAFSQTRPDTIYVMAGVNDLRQGATDQVILDNIRQIVRRLYLNHPQTQVILQSILPTRVTAISNERIRNLNQQIAVIAQQEGAGYLNLHSLFADGQGQLGQDLTTDGIHLTARGYQVWQEGLNYAESALAANRVAQVNN
ncbi:MAG TPA: GDSL-type esterase/lipase family protein [Coleofasciculaceae cyanobacterium]|jgi:lysophospholipase L1-like esterase